MSQSMGSWNGISMSIKCDFPRCISCRAPSMFLRTRPILWFLSLLSCSSNWLHSSSSGIESFDSMCSGVDAFKPTICILLANHSLRAYQELCYPCVQKHWVKVQMWNWWKPSLYFVLIIKHSYLCQRSLHFLWISLLKSYTYRKVHAILESIWFVL